MHLLLSMVARPEKGAGIHTQLSRRSHAVVVVGLHKRQGRLGPLRREQSPEAASAKRYSYAFLSLRSLLFRLDPHQHFFFIYSHRVGS